MLRERSQFKTLLAFGEPPPLPLDRPPSHPPTMTSQGHQRQSSGSLSGTDPINGLPPPGEAYEPKNIMVGGERNHERPGGVARATNV